MVTQAVLPCARPTPPTHQQILHLPPPTSISPGTTGLRNRQASTPPKKNNPFAVVSSGSNIQSPASCAMASTCNTPVGEMEIDRKKERSNS